MPVPVAEALLYVPALWGIFVLFRVLRFPDISADGVFSLGSISGAFILFLTRSVTAAIAGAFFAGALAGATTSILYSFSRVPKLLAGIIMYSALFSLNLKFFDRPNVSLPLDAYTRFSPFTFVIGLDVLVLAGLTYVLATRFGHSLVAVGSNPLVLAELGAPTRLLLAIGMGVGNGFIATAGVLASLYFGFSDVSLGTGMLVHSVAALMIGERLGRGLQRWTRCLTLFMGALAYYGLVYMVVRYLSFGLLTYSDYRIVSGLVIVALFALQRIRNDEVIPLS